MRLVKTSRKYHKWLMLFLGIQFVIWTISGAYMVIFDIDYIHGDSLVVNHQEKIKLKNINYSLKQLVQDFPSAKNIEVGLFINQEVYRFNSADKKYLVDASSGKQLSPLTRNMAVVAAKHAYSGSGKVAEVELITKNPPFELSRRALPAWRVNFTDFGSPSLYISAQTGLLMTKRHEFWRTFDLMFSLHVMDYEDEAADNQLLFWFTLFSLIASAFGVVLTYFRVFKNTDNSTSSITEKRS
jgi:hypothetical protein